MLPEPVRSAFVMAVRVLGPGRASLLLRQDSQADLIVAAAVGIAPTVVPEIRVRLGQGIAGIVAERGLSLFGAFDDHTFLSAPIVTANGVEGVLNLTDRLGGGQFSAADMVPALSIARHIGQLLDYSRSVVLDAVTGLPNRLAAESVLAREIARGERSGSTVSVVFIDVDNLKSINDSHGHARGDDALRAIADGLNRVVRTYDFAARFGGDEFVLVLPGSRGTDQAIIARIEEAARRAGPRLGIPIALSIGVSRYPVDGRTPEQLLLTADARMYVHKRAKRPAPSVERPGNW